MKNSDFIKLAVFGAAAFYVYYKYQEGKMAYAATIAKDATSSAPQLPAPAPAPVTGIWTSDNTSTTPAYNYALSGNL